MILVVDDVAENIDILLAMLKDKDRITVALDGETALKIMRHQRPDLVLMDIVMPGMDGYEVLSKMQKDPELNSVPLYLVSACDSVEEVRKGLDHGAMGYLFKPYDSAQIFSAVDRHIHSRAYAG